MIYKFRMISGEDRAFLRDYEIDSCASFLDFHNFIRDDLGYEEGQLASFFIADQNWNKGIELTLLDMQNEGGPTAIPMDSLQLGDFIKNKKDRLLYVFDIFSDKAMFLELLDSYPQKKGVRYPICSAQIGNPPAQFDSLNEVDNTLDENSIQDMFNDLESDEYGSEGYDGDER